LFPDRGGDTSIAAEDWRNLSRRRSGVQLGTIDALLWRSFASGNELTTLDQLTIDFRWHGRTGACALKVLEKRRLLAG